MESAMPQDNSEHVQSLELQLQICRAMLAVAYRERNSLEAALTRAEATIDQLRRQRHHEHQLLRTWILRCTAINPSQN